MTEGGPPFRTVAVATTGALAGGSVGVGWASLFLEQYGSLKPEVQIALVAVAGLVILAAEIGLIVIAVHYMRLAAAWRHPVSLPLSAPIPRGGDQQQDELARSQSASS